MKRLFVRLTLISLLTLTVGSAAAQNVREMCSKFVHGETGGGRDGTLERPARDLGNLISDLIPGDVVCIAEGEYTGRGQRGVDSIEIPVSIIGGFSADFSARDPWGAHKTIFTGLHNSDNFETQTRLSIDTSNFATRLMDARGEETAHSIVVDGIIFDNGARNYYADETESRIIRQGTPSHTPTPESGALTVRTGLNATVLVQNNIAINFAPTEGVFSFFGGMNADISIRNNIAANNTGAGFRIGTAFTGDDVPRYSVSNNISVFNQKHTPFGSFGGSGIMLESSTQVEITNSIFAFNDNYGVDNSKRAPELILNNNIIAANANADYMEFDIKMRLIDIEDEGEFIRDARGNSNAAVSFDVNPQWGNYYASRNVIDRNAAEAEVRAVDAWYNDVRSFFGWNVIGTDLDVDSDIWLPRLSLDDALNIAVMVDGKGVTVPAAERF